MTSKDSLSVAEQRNLELTRKPNAVDVPLEMVWSCKSQGKAFTLACDASGLEDGEIAFAMDIDAGTFSRIKKGTNTLHGDDLAKFCRVVGNNIVPQWLAYQVGCGLVVLKTEAERRAEAAEARASEAEKKLAWALEIIDRRAA